MVGFSGSGWRAKLVLVTVGVACLLGVTISVAAGDDATPTWKLKTYVSRAWDRSFKADLYEEMPRVPRVLIFGGSRGLRMDPSTITRHTGLAAFNFALHNGRPEDAWAVTDWVLDTHPESPPTVIWCMQATTLADVPIAPGLILDERLSQAFPASLVNAKMRWAERQRRMNILNGRRFGPDGMLYWNGYDRRRQEGLTLQQSLTQYLDADMLARAGNHKLPHHTRSQAYFIRTVRLLNSYHIKPLIVIMPYHPRALSAFMSVGWGVKQQWLRAYLKQLQKTLDFRVLDCLHIRTFGGSRPGFYDGAHLTAENSRRLIRYCITKAPGCFRVPPTPSPTPSASPTPSESPSSNPSPSPSESASPGATLVAPPAYSPVPEDTSAPADLLE